MQTDHMGTWESAVLWLRSQQDAADLVKACFYDDPLLEAAERYHASSEWKAMRGLLRGMTGRALDVGAGRGISSYALAKDNWSVSALEPDGSAVVGAGAIRGLALTSGFEIEVIQTWGEKLPFDDNTFDLVHARQVLHHAQDLTQLCREIHRVLKNDGLMIATREHVISRSDDLPVFLASHPLHKLYGGEHAYMLCEYKAALQLAGLKIEQVLNPMESDINLYPLTKEDVKHRWSRRLRLPLSGLIPNAALSFMGARSKVPGRLYTFVARKSDGK